MDLIEEANSFTQDTPVTASRLGALQAGALRQLFITTKLTIKT
jgi:hypothetical protein